MARLVHDGLSEGVFKAENAKAVGNEKFQAGGFADALDWYDRSLKLIDDADTISLTCDAVAVTESSALADVIRMIHYNKAKSTHLVDSAKKTRTTAQTA